MPFSSLAEVDLAGQRRGVLETGCTQLVWDVENVNKDPLHETGASVSKSGDQQRKRLKHLTVASCKLAALNPSIF